MNKIKDIEPSKVDSTMQAISSVIKAVVTVAKCIDSFRNKPELKEKAVV